MPKSPRKPTRLANSQTMKPVATKNEWEDLNNEVASSKLKRHNSFLSDGSTFDMSDDGVIQTPEQKQHMDNVETTWRANSYVGSATIFISLTIFLVASFWGYPDNLLGRWTNTFEYSSRVGLMFAGALFLLFSMIFLPNSYVSRPHPIYWRFVMGLAVLYMMFMTFLLF